MPWMPGLLITGKGELNVTPVEAAGARVAVCPTGTAMSLGPEGVWICCICIRPCGVMILICGCAVIAAAVAVAGCCSKICPWDTTGKIV